MFIVNDSNEQLQQRGDIYKEIEITYIVDLLKKKSTTYAADAALAEVFRKAKTTMAVLSTDLITMDITNEKIFEHYSAEKPSGEAGYSKREIAIKLLLRCKKMYEARGNVSKILKMIIKKVKEVDPWLHHLSKPLQKIPSQPDGTL